jgi:Fe-S cluster biogenesis protein NfuA
MHKKVERAINKIRPALGVNIVELVDVTEGVVQVRVIPSACAAGMPLETIIVLLEEQIKEDIPEIKEVVAVD